MLPNGTTSTPEEWRAVVGYEGWYSVSNLGRVRRDANGYIRKPVVTRTGYLVLNLCKGSRDSTRRHFVHTLVAEAFIGSRPTIEHGINHRNTIKIDNRPENLEWATPAQNNAHAGSMGLKPRGDQHPSHKHPERLARGERNGAYTKPESRRRGSLNGRAQVTEADAATIQASSEKRNILAARYNVSPQVIYRIRSGKTWKHIR